MLVLFTAELASFFTQQTYTNIIIDPNQNSLLRINFNVTVFDVTCEYAMIDVVDVLGTRSDNITKNINKWNVDASGIRRGYEGRNVNQRDIEHDSHHNLEELLRNGQHAPNIDQDHFEESLKRNQYTFVNFYAPWCSWCQRLEPVWEALAEKVDADGLQNIKVVKVDCVANAALCQANKIQAFPTLKMFKGLEQLPPDYRSDRTVEKMFEFIKDKVLVDGELQKMPVDEQMKHKESILKSSDMHPGCMLQGYLLVNRVPGNFHIEARSVNHKMNPKMSNLSHEVHHMSFGPVLSKRAGRYLSSIKKEIFDLQSTHPMDGTVYVSKQTHEAYHHYIDIVSTSLEVGRYRGSNEILAYQMVQSSQIMHYQDDDIPEARFSYDLSPMAVDIEVKGKRWYQFVTSTCALIGGVFTVSGLLAGFLGLLFKQKKI